MKSIVSIVYTQIIFTRESTVAPWKRTAAFKREKVERKIFRSRVEWVDEGEKPSKFFLNLEKRNHVSKLIYHLTNDDNEQIFDQDGIQQETYNFYKKLYKFLSL